MGGLIWVVGRCLFERKSCVDGAGVSVTVSRFGGFYFAQILVCQLCVNSAFLNVNSSFFKAIVVINGPWVVQMADENF